ncbi:hypothetical protein ACP46_gp70 [Rhizobium phage RHEph06]|uniref:DUF165 domain-containing protein n=4 Tax=Kleczkowskavirus RHEph4 TaxID=1921526 RepID=A0A7S5URA4_9CAUD|nr:hypothetical protein ACP46_gp70 [Rhizobium phage RHEph06]YP_009598511.1 hypothetical protein FDH25_gp69 [Rhizobium phage RHEph04]AGC35831.1 hypothetical protein RHEph05_gp064 [Rhizobium phage RHEph05]QIG67695.1 DUF165 domain-containing protein [Rhizobium phage RHph_Y17]QIG69014.1 DUF165 domain-containing protein [Rhizobium phage RHph_Y3_43]QIG69563.1 DUF165 domain-containing protein [Rhizobium phage RHph_I36]QIG75437.1 DUF165 domain-containing protein [Rhizobium phage RHph_Y1_1]QIG75987.1
MRIFSKLLAPAVLLYVASVVMVNIGFSYVPLIPTDFGLLSPMAFVVGAVFVIRDFAQRQSGHFVLVAMLAATVASYLLADPFVAIASALAFITSEVADYLLYSFTKKPFHHRVLISSLVSTPIDTAVFLLGIQNFTTGTFVLMVLSKLVAAVVIFLLYKARGERQMVNPYLNV